MLDYFWNLGQLLLFVGAVLLVATLLYGPVLFADWVRRAHGYNALRTGTVIYAVEILLGCIVLAFFI